MLYRVSEERLNELKSRLRMEAARDFIKLDIAIWLVIIPTGHLTITPDLIFLGGAYLFALIISFLNRQFWVSHNARVIVDHFSVKLSENSIICRQGNFEWIFDLQNINYEINRHCELTIKSENRKFLNFILYRRTCRIPQETNQYQNILNRLETVAKTVQPSAERSEAREIADLDS